MIRFRQRNLVWLAILTVMTALAVIGADIPALEVVLMGLLGAAAVASMLDLRAARADLLVGALQQRVPGSTNSRITAQAREAVARASSRGAGTTPGLTLLDVGLIATATGDEGMTMRRTRTISKDDDGVRPFITLEVAPYEADRNALLRFEIIDQSGREQYIHEMRVYLRDGEVNILADHHLPLLNNGMIEGFGDWDLRVFLDGKMIGVHGFDLAPSDEDRRSRLSGGTRTRRYIMESADEAEEAEEDIPMTLEQLLRNQSQNQNRNSSR